MDGSATGVPVTRSRPYEVWYSYSWGDGKESVNVTTVYAYSAEDAFFQASLHLKSTQNPNNSPSRITDIKTPWVRTERDF